MNVQYKIHVPGTMELLLIPTTERTSYLSVTFRFFFLHLQCSDSVL